MTFSFTVDGFRILYICITTIMWVFSLLFSIDYFPKSRRSGRYYIPVILTYISTVGIFLSADLLTTFIFFELLSLVSYPMVAYEGSKDALKAAETYLAIAVIGGMTTLMGLLLLRNLTGTLEMKLLNEACKTVGEKGRLYVFGALILVGFGAKAGLFPLHVWLPKAHPVAPAPASALLSGILTKCGVFGVVVVSCEVFRGDVSWGLAILVTGAVTMLLGAVLAIFPVDLKRTLACSSVSQIGFITVGIAMQCILGDHNALAIRGVILHMVNHSVFKLILFLCAGVVYIDRHSTDLNKVRGFGRRKPIFAFVFLTAAAGIAGVPLFSGYISKTLLHESIVEGIGLFSGVRGVAGILRTTELLFIFTGGLTAAYMLKLIEALFGRESRGNEQARALERTPMNEQARANEPGQKREQARSNEPGQQREQARANESGQAKYIGRTSAAILTVSAAAVLAAGVFPVLMDSIAGAGEGFMHGHAPEHAVRYFTWENLRGAFYSLSTGALVYFLIIRRTQIKFEKQVFKPLADVRRRRTGWIKFEKGAPEYVDRWPPALDLENLVYRPLISMVTCAGEFLARIAEAVPSLVISSAVKAAEFFARIADALPDALIGLIRKTLLQPLKQGRFPGKFFGRYYRIVIPEKNERPAAQPVVHAGFSLSLLLLGFGLCAMLGCLMYMALR